MALGIAAAACSCAASPRAGTVTILVPWSGPQLTAFKVIAKAFTKEYGITVVPESTRGLTDVLSTDLRQGGLPDVADLPSIGAVDEYVAQGQLKEIGAQIAPGDYGPLWLGLMKVRGHFYAAPVKIDVKSLVWYYQAMLSGRPYPPPQNWQQLVALSTAIRNAGRRPWCVALSSAPVSGWPGADWIADILLSTDGPGVYQQWVDGQLAWSSKQVIAAWQLWGNLIGLSDPALAVPRTALDTTVEKHAIPALGGCYLEHGTLTDTFKPGKYKSGMPPNYDFLRFPSESGALQVSADFIVMFKASPQAKLLVNYLTRDAVQEQWMHMAGAGGFSANENVPASVYPHGANGPNQRIANILDSAPEVCFGAADAMRPDLSEAFDHSAWRYVTQPGSLTSSILPILQTVTMHTPYGADQARLPALKVCGADRALGRRP